MEQNKKLLRICIVTVVLAAVLVGMVYYYHETKEQTISGKGMLITSCEAGCQSLWR